MPSYTDEHVASGSLADGGSFLGDASHPIGHHTSHTLENGASSGGCGGCRGGGSEQTTDLKTPRACCHAAESMQSHVQLRAPPSPMAAGFSIIDSTLREGEQFATAHFTTVQKIKIAQALDAFGVEFIEVTSPVASAQSRADCETICKLGLNAKILCHIRCNIDDARVAIETGVDGVNMCIGTSSYLMKDSHGKDLDYIAKKAVEVIDFVKSHGIEVRFSGEDSFRSDFGDLLDLYSLVDRAGVQRVGIADTVGTATSLDVFDKISALRQVISCDIETHFHNDTGCAIANAYTALEAGATHIDTTVLGIGERNGITSLGGLVAVLLRSEHRYLLTKYNLEKLGDLDRLVSQIVDVEIPFKNFSLTALELAE
ncbi:homocitrate synthase [Plectosphaerella plurivora]|uniref:Homocitrate synthase n=1 Tax=Plectosphaerella plurivora TaxID=936078 RepID=A0A9P8VBB6_9PEZI|nr:homocitrate synthase [Plectosphaerella plurivora]